MPQITYQSQVSALSNRSNSPLQSANTDPNVYGAGVGRAMQELGQATSQSGRLLAEVDAKQKDKERREKLATFIATRDFSEKELQLRNSTDIESGDYVDNVVNTYTSWAEDQLNGLDDDELRSEARIKLMSDLPNITSRAAQFQYQSKNEIVKNRGNEAINALQNKISLDPTSYDKFRDEGAAVIDALPDMTAAQKEGMKLTWKYDTAKRRFDGMINNVKTVEDIDNISMELAGGEGARDWQSEMLPSDYENLMNSLGTMRKTFNDKNNADARSLISSAEERMKTTTSLLPSDELKQMQEVALRSSDRSLQMRAARIMRNQELIRQEKALPPAELRARYNAANGDPGVAYPELPVEVSNAVNSASEKFGVSPSLLGAMAVREYGSEFAKAKAKNKQPSEFIPKVAHKDIDLRNIRTDVKDAVTLAGQAYGAPLVITAAGKGVTTSSTAINIATVGMDGVDKAKVAASLVDAGFTGISEYDGYMQADMTRAVPQSFGDVDGKTWGGWTYLSPEVSAVLKEKGYKPGAEASSIMRSAISSDKATVNYNAPTSIVDANGNPTSTAVGVFQFTEKTWLATIKNPTVASAMGVDLTLGDDELLKLRGDPQLSTMAAAAYAKANEKTLMNTLGRQVSEAELYMAHFMGAGGATTFLTAFKDNPQQSAADLLPSAASSNKNVFYDKQGNPLSVQKVYDNISRGFTLAPSRVAYEDNEMRKALLDKAEKTLKEYPITHAMEAGSHVISSLADEGGFAARGAQIRSVADYYTIPLRTANPFTQDEEAQLKKTLVEGNVADTLALMANIQSMGDEPAKAALKQLGQTDSVFAHAAGLYLEGGTAVAGDIIRGRKRMEANPAILEQIGADKSALSDQFITLTGGAVFDVEPSRRQAVQDAATALYIEHMASSGGNMNSFDSDVYAQSVQEVLGGSKDMPAIADVNGSPTLIPKGLAPEEVENALYGMALDDWISMSESGDPPRYADGSVVDVRDIRDEVMLRSVGGGQYKVMLEDGTFLTTGKRTSDGRWKTFILVPDAKRMKNVASYTDVSYDMPRGMGVSN